MIIYRVTTGNRRKTVTIISAIIVGVLIATAILTLSVIYLNKNLRTRKEGIILEIRKDYRSCV